MGLSAPTPSACGQVTTLAPWQPETAPRGHQTLTWATLRHGPEQGSVMTISKPLFIGLLLAGEQDWVSCHEHRAAQRWRTFGKACSTGRCAPSLGEHRSCIRRRLLTAGGGSQGLAWVCAKSWPSVCHQPQVCSEKADGTVLQLTPNTSPAAWNSRTLNPLVFRNGTWHGRRGRRGHGLGLLSCHTHADSVPVLLPRRPPPEPGLGTATEKLGNQVRHAY